jgi:hypothetical protein
MNLKFVKFAAYMILVVGLSAVAFASCGDTLSAMAAEAASIRSQSRPMQPGATSAPDQASYASIVGLWHIRFVIGDHTIQEAFQLWNAGGTEVHNPNVDPRSGNVCLGVWKRQADRVTYKLTHRVWIYDTDGNFGGTIHLSETLRLGDHGTTHSGSFALDFYDAAGNFQSEVPGSVVAERIPVE